MTGKSDAGVAIPASLDAGESCCRLISLALGLGPFSSFSLRQPAVRVIVQSWTGLSAQSASKPSVHL